MCGKECWSEMNIGEREQLNPIALQRRIEDAEDGWILQINGESLDIYCSEACAK